MAIQLARELGARVAVTAGTKDKLEACRALGADILVNYKKEDFVEVVQEETGGAGADVVLDNMGAKYLARNLTVLARNGRLVVIGLQGGATAEIDLGLMLTKRVALFAASLRFRPVEEKAAIVRSTVEHVWPLLSSGAVRPVVHATYPLAEAGEAHRVMEASTHIGKLLLIT
jgi:NADPH:quinone reductase-like Zn-dependent oxidoreductase